MAKPTIFSYLNSYDGIVRPIIPPTTASFTRVSQTYSAGLFTGINAISCPQSCDPTTDIRYNGFTFTNKGTVEILFKPTWGWNGTQSTDGYQHIPMATEWENAKDSNYGFTYVNFHHGEYVYFDMYNPWIRVSIYDITVIANTWNHIALTWDGTAASNQMKVYFNNILKGQASGWNGSGTSTRNWLVGSSASYGAPRTEGLNGLEQNFKFWNGIVKTDFSDRLQLRSGMDDQKVIG